MDYNFKVGSHNKLLADITCYSDKERTKVVKTFKSFKEVREWLGVKSVGNSLENASEKGTLSRGYYWRVEGTSDYNDEAGTTVSTQEEMQEKITVETPLNMILYGPPGTGKTYNTVNYAVSIVEKKQIDNVVEEAKENRQAVFNRYKEYLSGNKIVFTTFHQNYSYEEFIQGIRANTNNNEGLSFIKEDGIFKNIVDIAKDDPDNNYVIIIDEINRGNISKIFGELITLIEPSKRIGQVEGASAKLPYSKKPFGVPDNVYLIGTMNTADRSIATIDTALRRRFQFKEMQPNPEVLEGINVEGISIKDMLTRMNKKISVLFDREHTIGHAYFMPLKKDNSLDALAVIFENNIIPLLQEYFYDDYEKIRLVLGDNRKANESEQFVVAKATDYSELFGDTDLDSDDAFSYEINKQAFGNIEAYKYI